MNSAAFAATIRAKYPQYANVADDELTRLVITKYPSYATQIDDLSVADTARARLANRGLTPEAIKANPDVAVSSPDDFRVTNRERPGLLDYLATAGTTAANMIPVNALDPTMPFTAGPMMGAEVARNLVQANIDFPDDPVRRNIQQAASVVPFVGGTIRDLLQPSFVATEREPTPEERLGAMGAAVQVGAAALPAAAKGSLARGPGIASRAEAAYADALSTPATRPLTESLASQMMERGIKPSSPAALSEGAAIATERATAARDAAAQANPAPNVWRSTPARREGAAAVRAAEAEVKFQTDLKTVADALAEQGSGGNILTGVAKRVATKAVTMATGSRAAGIALDNVLKRLPSSLTFKTASAIAKKRFGEAMSKGDKALAAEIGAGIATGALAADDFGHRAAITSLAQEVESLGGPDLRRQAVASKRGYYKDADGREIPRNVMSALVDAPDVNEADSPLNRWLTAMASQKKIAKGGQITFR